MKFIPHCPPVCFPSHQRAQSTEVSCLTSSALGFSGVLLVNVCFVEEALFCDTLEIPPKQLQTKAVLEYVTSLGKHFFIHYQIPSHLIPLAENEPNQINLNGLTQASLFISNLLLCLGSICNNNNNNISRLIIFIKVTTIRCFPFYPVFNF